MRRAGITFASLVVSAAIAAGCNSTNTAKSVPSTPATEQDTTTTATRPQAKSEIYAAVIRQLVTEDHGFGGAPSPYRHVYVRNAPVQGAGNAMTSHLRPRAGFAEPTLTAIASQLGDLPPLTFVSASRQATVGSFRNGGWPHAKNGGVLITLGPIRWVGRRTVLVPNSRWATPLNGQWLTYRLKHSDGSWRVVGTVGPVAIS
jgi:hypothetical protein